MAVRIDSTFALPNDCGCLIAMLPNRGVQKWKCEQKRRHSRFTLMFEAFKRHLLGLLNYFKQPLTNAMSEGLNSKIQQIKSNAGGL